MRFSFVIASEPTGAFCRMACLWAWSLRRNAGALSGSPLKIIFNDRADPDTARWLGRLPDVEVSARPRLSSRHKELNKYSALFAPGLEESDYVVLTDCDVACAGPLDNFAADLAGAEFGAVSDGALSDADGSYRPSVCRYGRMLADLSGLGPNVLQSHRRDEFARNPPFTGFPYFNGGVLVIAGNRLRDFRAAVIEISGSIYDRVLLDQKYPLRLVKRAWNGLWAGVRGGERFMLGWHVRRKRFADQAAIFPAVLKIGMTYRVLPHDYNWRPGGETGADAVPRLIHYYRAASGVAPAQVLRSDWIPGGLASGQPGRRALAQVVEEFLRQNGDCPCLAAP